MYPLNVILVGCTGELQAQVKKELSNRAAHIEAEVANAVAAIDQFIETREEQRLLLYYLGSGAGGEELRRLSGTFVGMPVLALVEAGRDPQQLLQANRAGATQVVGLPLDAADFQAALDQVAVHFGYTDSHGMTVLVSPVVGDGDGTVVAYNLAHAIGSRPDLRCLYIELTPLDDLKPATPNGGPRPTLTDLVRGKQRLDIYQLQEALVRGPDNLDILPGPAEATAGGAVSAADLAEVLTYARWMAEAVVMQLPCTFDDPYFQMAAAADEVVLLADQELPALRSMKLALEAFAGLPKARLPHVVVNGYDPHVKGLTRDDLRQYLQVREVWTIAADFQLAQQARPWRQAAPRSPATVDMNRIAHALLGARDQEEAARESAHLGWLGRMFHLTR
jgi:MinD-like ATPase involved in chromosome partitioning or flagellar assembly